MSRRRFLALGGVGAAGLLLGGGVVLSRNRLLTSPTFADYPFTLGVASGEPVHDGYSARVVLWTRLAPDPLNGGGMPPNDVEVRWEMATDENFTNIVQSGTEVAPAREAHSVHVAPYGLEPARYYWYRFKAGSEISPVGRTKTPPAAGTPLSAMSFVFASCADYQEGYFPAYRAIAEEEDLDVVFHLGDYIYEYGIDPDSTRVAQTPAPTDLESYRNTYAEYRLDPDLQAAHAMHPFEVIPDDHEVYNNFAGPAEQEAQATAALLAYWEHMPLRPSASPRAAEGANLLLYRYIEYGDLARFAMLDTRQYRGEPPDPESGTENDSADPNVVNDMIGQEQETWLFETLNASEARWNVIGNQIGMFDYISAGPDGDIMGWDDHGYARDRIARYLDDNRPSNPVVITGDLHCSWVADLKAYYPDENSATVGTEFIGTSITSSLGEEYEQAYRDHLEDNPHVRFFDERTGGYVRCDVTPDEWRTEMKLAGSIEEPDSPVRTFASFVVEDGQPGAKQV